jgi:hypothetical protein
LAILDRLAQFDKHRTLLVWQAYITGDLMLGPADVEPVEVVPGRANPLSEKHPTELFRARFAPGVDVHMQMEGNVPVEPAIGDGVTQRRLGAVVGAQRRVQEIVEQVAALPRVQG